MRAGTLVAILLLLSWPAQANDRASSGVGGSLCVADGKHPSVEMMREWVRLDVYRSYYVTRAEFEFRNQGPPVTVLMGFPETGSQDDGKASRFAWFRTWVDGQEVQARRQLVWGGGEGHYLAHWTKQVHFGAGQRRRVWVEYRSKPGRTADGARYVRLPVARVVGAQDLHRLRTAVMAWPVPAPSWPGPTSTPCGHPKVLQMELAHSPQARLSLTPSCRLPEQPRASPTPTPPSSSYRLPSLLPGPPQPLGEHELRYRLADAAARARQQM